MFLYTFLRALFSKSYIFFCWSDTIEILFFSCVFYYFSLWLKSDTQKNLLAYFYAYMTVLFITYYVQLTTINTFLFICAPAVIVIFIVLHQETLQKNFITLKNIKVTNQDPTDWIETLLRTSLVAINHNRQMLCVIEHKDNLQTSISSPFFLHTDVQKNLLDMVLTSNSFDPSKLIWVSSGGKIRGINAEWKKELEERWLSDEIKKLHKWKQDALFYTGKTDALVFKITPTTRTFDIVVQGQSFENISTNHAFGMIKRYMAYDQHRKGKDDYDFKPKENNIRQRHS